MTDNRSSKPVKKFNAGGVQAAVWENTRERDGDEIVAYSVTLDKRYKAADGTWQSTTTLQTADLPKAVLVLQKAYEFAYGLAGGESP